MRELVNALRLEVAMALALHPGVERLFGPHPYQDWRRVPYVLWLRFIVALLPRNVRRELERILRAEGKLPPRTASLREEHQ